MIKIQVFLPICEHIVMLTKKMQMREGQEWAPGSAWPRGQTKLQPVSQNSSK